MIIYIILYNYSLLYSLLLGTEIQLSDKYTENEPISSNVRIEPNMISFKVSKVQSIILKRERRISSLYEGSASSLS